MNKTTISFFNKYKMQIILSTIALILLICILCYALIPIKTKIELIDYNDGGKYSYDMRSEIEDGLNLEEFENISKVGEFTDNSSKLYNLHYNRMPYTKNKDGFYLIENFSIKENLRYVKKGGEDNLKIEIYVSSNIKNKDIIKNTLKFNYIHDDFTLANYLNGYKPKVTKIFGIYHDGDGINTRMDVFGNLFDLYSNVNFTLNYLFVITIADDVNLQFLQ